MKKLNAVLGLLILPVMFCHAGIMCFSMRTFWYNFIICKALARMAGLLLILHALCAIAILIFCHDTTPIPTYKRLNLRTVLQRISAALMVVLFLVHTHDYAFLGNGQALTFGDTIRICITEVLYISSVLVHVALSFSRGLITLGWVQSRRTLKTIDTIVGVLCLCGGVAAITIVLSFML